MLVKLLSLGGRSIIVSDGVSGLFYISADCEPCSALLDHGTSNLRSPLCTSFFPFVNKGLIIMLAS